jgi:hypothetical protein
MVDNREGMMILGKWARIYGIVLGVLCIIAMGAAFAQQGKQPLSASEIVAKMKQNLNLTDAQVNQITPIIEEEIQQRQAIMEQAKVQGLDQAVVKSHIAALRQSTQEKIAQCLRSGQLTKLQNNPQPMYHGGNAHRVSAVGMGSSEIGSINGNGR